MAIFLKYRPIEAKIIQHRQEFYYPLIIFLIDPFLNSASEDCFLVPETQYNKLINIDIIKLLVNNS